MRKDIFKMAENQYVNKVALSDGTTLIDLTSDTVTAADVAEGVTAHDMTGAPIVGTNTYDSDTSEDTAVIGEVLSGKTFHARGAGLTGTMANNGAVAGLISALSPYAVPVGYHDGTGTVSIDPVEAAKIIPGNIKEGVTVLGVVGAHSGAESVTSRTATATPSWVQQVVLPGQGYDYLSQVTVAPIPLTETDNSAGGKTVTIG